MIDYYVALAAVAAADDHVSASMISMTTGVAMAAMIAAATITGGAVFWRRHGDQGPAFAVPFQLASLPELYLSGPLSCI